MPVQPGVLISILPLLLLLVIVPVMIVLTVLPFWRIFSKAGFHGALSLLMLIPLANVVMLFFLAFADWPALKDQASNSPE